VDITYFIAGFIALGVGFAAAIAFVVIRGRSTPRMIAIASTVAMALDFALLINWTQISANVVPILLVDCLFFAIYSLVGCTLGTLPVMLARFAWRKVLQNSK